MTALSQTLIRLLALAVVTITVYLSWYMLLDDDQPFCTSEEFKEGRWVYRPLQINPKTPRELETIAGYHSKHSFPHKCYNKKGSFARSVAMLEYQWEPTSCQMPSLDPVAVSNQIAQHPLLFVGDSVSEIQFHSANALLGEHLVNRNRGSNLTGGHPDMWHHERIHKEHQDDPNAVTLAFVRSDYLVRTSDFALIRPFDDPGPSIGRDGLHWVYDDLWGPNHSREELMTAYTKGMNVVFQYLKENVKPHQRVWYRSTPYGHKSCSQYKEPLETPVLPPPDMYNWDMLSSFDEVWREWIDAQNDRRFQFLDVSHLSNLRGDVHSKPDRDCVHTCIPGPVDEWNKILFQEIMMSSGNKHSSSFSSIFKLPFVFS